MTTPEEYEKSRKRYAWKLAHRLDQLHIELAGLYKSSFKDQRRIDATWRAIEENEQALEEIGFSYEHYTQARR